MPVVEVKSRTQVNLGRFRLVVDVLFYLCLTLTAASLFFDLGFRTALTAAASLILRLVRMSASEMSESKG
jgi:hypothetical protein